MTPPLGWSVPDLELSAVVARFHRGALPRARHKALRQLAAADRKLAIYLAGVLRLANSLDGRRDGQISRLQLTANDGCLELSVAGYTPWTATALEVAAARHVLEVILHKPIMIKPLKVARSRVRAPRALAPAHVA